MVHALVATRSGCREVGVSRRNLWLAVHRIMAFFLLFLGRVYCTLVPVNSTADRARGFESISSSVGTKIGSQSNSGRPGTDFFERRATCSRTNRRTRCSSSEWNLPTKEGKEGKKKKRKKVKERNECEVEPPPRHPAKQANPKTTHHHHHHHHRGNNASRSAHDDAHTSSSQWLG